MSLIGRINKWLHDFFKRKIAEKKEEKRIYKDAFKSAKAGEIKKKAKRDAKDKVNNRGSGGSLGGFAGGINKTLDGMIGTPQGKSPDDVMSQIIGSPQQTNTKKNKKR